MLKVNSSAFRLTVGVVLVNLFIYLLVGASIFKSRQQYERQASLTTQNLAHSLELTISGFLEKMDVSLFSVKNEVERELAGGGIDEKLLNPYIIREKSIIPIFEEMWVADKDGYVRYGTKLPPAKPINITDREYFKRIQANPEPGLVISKPVMGRITKAWSILISKRINNSDGSFAGSAFGSLRIVDYFDELFSKINVGEQGIIELRDKELGLIDQYPKTAGLRGLVGSKMISILTLDKIRANPDFVTFTTVFARDGIERTVSYKKITGYPLYIAVSLGRDEYLSAWRKEVVLTLSLLLLFTLITVFSARMFFLRSIQAELHKEEANSKAILEASPVPLILIEEQDRISYLNNAFVEQIGYNRDEIPTLADLRIRAYPDPQYRQVIIDKLGENFEELRGRAEHLLPVELNVTCKDGIVRNFILTVKFLQRDYSESILCSLYDITERKRADAKLQQTLDSLKKAVGTTIGVLVSAVESRDPYTAGHQLRVADLARSIATEMGLPSDKIEGIRMAGSIHDIGKLSIPAEILSKPTKLTVLEFSLIKEHPRIGYEMLKNVESPWPLAQIVYQHHERINGSGYPRNLKGDDILMEARIMAVADVVEAMASHRPYRPALGIEAALEEIEKNKGIFYDNAVGDACLKLFREKGYRLT